MSDSFTVDFDSGITVQQLGAVIYRESEKFGGNFPDMILASETEIRRWIRELGLSEEEARDADLTKAGAYKICGAQLQVNAVLGTPPAILWMRLVGGATRQ